MSTVTLQKEFLTRELFETMGVRPARLLLTPRKATRETGNVIWCLPARTQEIKYISSMFVLLSLKAASGLQLRAQSYQPACLGLFPGLLYSCLDHTALSAHTQGWFIFLPFKKTNEFLKIKGNCVLLGHSLPSHHLSSNQPGQSSFLAVTSRNVVSSKPESCGSSSVSHQPAAAV